MSSFDDYHPLQPGCIRLLWLGPGTDEAEIECRLIVTVVDRAGEYEALSYVWGNPNDTVEICCNQRPFSVTRNLYNTLRRIRHPTEIRALWVDAMCINQKDEAEKTSQVQMMGQIYYRATRVAVWLGEDERQTLPRNSRQTYVGDQLAFEHLPSVTVSAVTVFPLIRETAEMIDKQLAEVGSVEDLPQVLVSDMSKYDPDRWRALAGFFKLPWFTRGWVIQELGLAIQARLLWGEFELDYLEHYLPFIRWLATKASLVMDYFDIEIGTQFLVTDFFLTSRLALLRDSEDSSNSNRHNFLDVLSFARGMRSNYAESRKTIVSPDYSKSTEQVYLDVAKAFIHHFGNFEVLSYVTHEGRDFSVDRPTWVPRWDASKWLAPISGPYFYDACGSFTPNFRFHSDELHVRGVEVDTVEWTTAIPDTFSDGLFLDPKYDKEYRRNSFDSLFNMYKYQLWKRDRGMKPDRDGFQYTLAAGLLGDEPAEDHAEEFQACVSSFLYGKINQLPTAQRDAKLERLERLKKEAEGGIPELFLLTVQRVAEGRTFFFTRKGYIGLGSDSTTPGDAVWVICGSKVPSILRADANRHRLVGEAYLHGFMREEAVRDLTSDQFHDVKIY